MVRSSIEIKNNCSEFIPQVIIFNGIKYIIETGSLAKSFIQQAKEGIEIDKLIKIYSAIQENNSYVFEDGSKAFYQEGEWLYSYGNKKI